MSRVIKKKKKCDCFQVVMASLINYIRPGAPECSKWWVVCSSPHVAYLTFETAAVQSELTCGNRVQESGVVPKCQFAGIQVQFEGGSFLLQVQFANMLSLDLRRKILFGTCIEREEKNKRSIRAPRLRN